MKSKQSTGLQVMWSSVKHDNNIVHNSDHIQCSAVYAFTTGQLWNGDGSTLSV